MVGFSHKNLIAPLAYRVNLRLPLSAFIGGPSCHSPSREIGFVFANPQIGFVFANRRKVSPRGHRDLRRPKSLPPNVLSARLAEACLPFTTLENKVCPFACLHLSAIQASAGNAFG